MTHNERKHNCFCSVCGAPAAKGYKVRFGREITKRFGTYSEAAQFLSGLRFKEAEGTLDVRDYKADNPLSLKIQTARWLVIKEKEVSPETYRKYYRYINRAVASWGRERNVKTISFGDIEDFLFDESTAQNDKTRHDIRSCLNHFFEWLSKREGVKKPELPKISFELGWRAITNLETQQSIIDEIHKIAPAKVAFGIEMLATYTSLRPDDLRRVKEGEYYDGIVTFHNPTKKKNQSKVIRLLPEHAERWEFFRRKYSALPGMPFFRHHNLHGVKENTPFGEAVFYKWWKRACQNLGIEGLDLYGGTRHTTTTAIAKMVDERSAKKASGHMTNKAFERYCQAADETAFQMAKIVRSRSHKTDQHVTNIKTKGK